MGSGPFIPTELAKDVSLELERNPNYWKEGLPYIDGSIHYYIADKGTAIGAYRTGQVLMTNWPSTNLSNAEVMELQESESDILDVYLIPNTGFRGTTVEPFNDVRVRRAMHLAVNRSEFRFNRSDRHTFPSQQRFVCSTGNSHRTRRRQTPGRRRRGKTTPCRSRGARRVRGHHYGSYSCRVCRPRPTTGGSVESHIGLGNYRPNYRQRHRSHSLQRTRLSDCGTRHCGTRRRTRSHHW